MDSPKKADDAGRTSGLGKRAALSSDTSGQPPLAAQEPANSTTEITGPEKQHPALAELLRSINAARRQSCLYGPEHPASANCASELCEAIEAFLAVFTRATCMFTEKSVFVNDKRYEPSHDSTELLHRLRYRAGMAITFLGAPSPEQTAEFFEHEKVHWRQAVEAAKIRPDQFQ